MSIPLPYYSPPVPETSTTCKVEPAFSPLYQYIKIPLAVSNFQLVLLDIASGVIGIRAPIGLDILLEAGIIHVLGTILTDGFATAKLFLQTYDLIDSVWTAVSTKISPILGTYSHLESGTQQYASWTFPVPAYNSTTQRAYTFGIEYSNNMIGYPTMTGSGLIKLIRSFSSGLVPTIDLPLVAPEVKGIPPSGQSVASSAHRLSETGAIGRLTSDELRELTILRKQQMSLFGATTTK